jgi:hypothetical protein
LKNASATYWRPSIDSSGGPERSEFGHLRVSQRRSEGHFRSASEFFNSLPAYTNSQIAAR